MNCVCARPRMCICMLVHWMCAQVCQPDGESAGSTAGALKSIPVGGHQLHDIRPQRQWGNDKGKVASPVQGRD